MHQKSTDNIVSCRYLFEDNETRRKKMHLSSEETNRHQLITLFMMGIVMITLIGCSLVDNECEFGTKCGSSRTVHECIDGNHPDVIIRECSEETVCKEKGDTAECVLEDYECPPNTQSYCLPDNRVVRCGTIGYARDIDDSCKYMYCMNDKNVIYLDEYVTMKIGACSWLIPPCKNPGEQRCYTADPSLDPEGVPNHFFQPRIIECLETGRWTNNQECDKDEICIEETNGTESQPRCVPRPDGGTVDN